MFIFALALNLVTPADACAMPRYEQMAVVKPAPDAKNVDARKAADAPKEAPKTLADALDAIDAAGIPELQNAAVPTVPAPTSPPSTSAKVAQNDAPPLGKAD